MVLPELAKQIKDWIHDLVQACNKIHELEEKLRNKERQLKKKMEEKANIPESSIPLSSEMKEVTFSGKALKYCVHYTVERIKECAKLGKTYAPMITTYVDEERGGMLIDVGKEAVLKELSKYGYREYMEPVIIGGVRQTNDFVTWF